jgi:polyvinyl alcohol dehydrogenase (cytochrome)
MRSVVRRALLGGGLAGAVAGVAALFAVAAGQVTAAEPASTAPAGQVLYQARCAACHDNPALTRAPALDTVKAMPANQIRLSLTHGVMKQQAAGLSAVELDQLVGWLKPTPAGGAQAAADWIEPLRCAADKRTVDLRGKPTLTSYGVDLVGSRRMSAAQAGLTTRQLGDLEVAWTMAFPNTTTLRSQPVIIGSTMFYAPVQTASVLAIDTRTGCVKWDYKAQDPLKTSLAYGPLGPKGKNALIFGDSRGELHAIDAQTGQLVWKVDPRHDPNVWLTGAPVLYRDKIIVPISASDVARAMDPKYACCKSHGAVAALDAATGKILWTAHTMEDAKPIGRKNGIGIEMWGPSGAPIWSTPTIDVKRGLVYATTGENTSPPATPTSDAIMAIDLETGKTRWVWQALANDVWNMSCGRTKGANCPYTEEESVLRDFDFGSHAMLAKTSRGKDILLAGQKSGHIWALDPDKPTKPLWSQQFGPGSALGGVHWGIASDGKRVFVPINDPMREAATGEPGLNASISTPARCCGAGRPKPDCGNGRADRVAQCTSRYGLSAVPLVGGRRGGDRVHRRQAAGVRRRGRAGAVRVRHSPHLRQPQRRAGAGRGDRQPFGVGRRRHGVRGQRLRRLRPAARQRAGGVPAQGPDRRP